MPVPHDYSELVRLLSDATNEKRVNWKEDGGFLSVDFKEFRLQIWSGFDEKDNAAFVAMGIKDPNDRALIDNWHVVEGDEDFELMHTLYGAARRVTRKISDKIRLINEQLRSNQQVGEKPGSQDDIGW